jgi:hypothetical protein
VPSSLDKLQAAEQAGQLDADTGLLYRLYAYFDRDQLPAEYQGDDRALPDEPNDVFDGLVERMDAMSPAVRAHVLPFLLRPGEPGSFWNAPPSAATPAAPALAYLSGVAAPGAVALAAQAAATATAVPLVWAAVDSPNTNTRVWYPTPAPGSGEGLTKIAANLAQEIDASEMWKKEKETMLGKYEPCSDAHLVPNGGDGRLDLYLVAAGEGGPRNVDASNTRVMKPRINGVFIKPRQVPGRCPLAGYILLNSDRDWDHLRTTAAHELFHAFQSAVTVNSARPGWSWWGEASATWAKDLVYPRLNLEHEYLWDGQWAWVENRIGPLHRYGEGKVWQYGAYIWPFYLTHGGGALPEYIGRLWEASKDTQPIQVMAEINGWDDLWKQMALWNWNEGPADVYRDPDDYNPQGHITALREKAFDMVFRDSAGQGRWTTPGDPNWPGLPLRLGEEYSVPVKLPPASYEYYVSGAPPREAAQLRFDFNTITREVGGAVQAIISIGEPGKPPRLRYIEDWSRKTARIFCLDRPDEQVSSVVIVASHSGLRPGDPLDASLKVRATTDTCPNRSTLSVHTGGSYSLHSQGNGGAANGLITTQQGIESTWTLQFAERRPDEVRYDLIASNQIDLNAGARLCAQNGGLHSTITGRINGSRPSPTASVSGDDGFGRRTYPTMMQQDRNSPSPNGPGFLRLFKQDGKDAYMVNLGMTQIVPDYTYHLRWEGGCDTDPPTLYAYDLDYTNHNATTTIVEEGHKKCLRYGGRNVSQEAGPTTFGGITLDRTRAGQPGMQHKFITGYYDPKSDVIEGYETYAAPDCFAALHIDPLADFVTHMDGMLRVNHSTFADGPQQATCQFTYSVSWRIELPKQEP